MHLICQTGHRDSFSKVEVRVVNQLSQRHPAQFLFLHTLSPSSRKSMSPSLPKMWSNSCRVGGHKTSWDVGKEVPSKEVPSFGRPTGLMELVGW